MKKEWEKKCKVKVATENTTSNPKGSGQSLNAGLDGGTSTLAF